MKLAVLFSGGKDSSFALWKAKEQHEIVCLVSMLSDNSESYMFQTANIEMTNLLSEAIGLPIIQRKTKGQKEDELEDLKNALIEARNTYGIEGVVTGALKSVYQAGRIQKICRDLNLWCFNPLWLKDQVQHLKDIVNNGFKVIISGVFAFPLDEKYLGRIIDDELIAQFEVLHKKYLINPAGEGGEIETTTLDAPFFRKKVEIINAVKKYEENSGTYTIEEARLVDKS